MTRENVLEKLRAHKTRLIKEYGIARMGLFGSVARGDAGSLSDVDVAVRLVKPELSIVLFSFGRNKPNLIWYYSSFVAKKGAANCSKVSN